MLFRQPNQANAKVPLSMLRLNPEMQEGNGRLHQHTLVHHGSPTSTTLGRASAVVIRTREAWCSAKRGPIEDLGGRADNVEEEKQDDLAQCIKI